MKKDIKRLIFLEINSYKCDSCSSMVSIKTKEDKFICDNCKAEYKEAHQLGIPYLNNLDIDMNYSKDTLKANVNISASYYKVSRDKYVYEEHRYLEFELDITSGKYTLFSPSEYAFFSDSIVSFSMFDNIVLNIENMNKVNNLFKIIREYNMDRYDVFIPEINLKRTLSDILKAVVLFNRWPLVESSYSNLSITLISEPEDKGLFAHNTKDLVKDYLLSKKVSVNKITRNIVSNLYKFNKKSKFSYVFNTPIRTIGLKSDKEIFDAYNRLEKKLSVDNLQKVFLGPTNLDDEILKSFARVLDVFALSDKKKNRLCNIIQAIKTKKDSNEIHFLKDAFNSLQNIYISMDNYKDYVINLKGSIKEIHDRFSSDYQKLKHINKIIPYEKDFNVNWESNDYRFAIAKNTYELLETGIELNICVGSYDKIALTGGCIIVLMKEKATNKTVVCIELAANGRTVRQVKARFNHKATKEQQLCVYKWIKEFKLSKATCDLESYDSLMGIGEEVATDTAIAF